MCVRVGNAKPHPIETKLTKPASMHQAHKGDVSRMSDLPRLRRIWPVRLERNAQGQTSESSTVLIHWSDMGRFHHAELKENSKMKSNSESRESRRSGGAKLVVIGVLVAVVAGAGIWFVMKQSAGAAQSNATEELTGLGATVIKTSDGKPNSLILATPGKDPIDLAEALPLAANLSDLDSLLLSGTSVSDDQLQLVAKISGLGDLQLADTPITSAGIKHLVGLSNLTSLYVSNTKVGSDALSDIAKLKSLKVLGIAGTAISGGFDPLEALQDLTLLVAGGLEISDQDAEAITRIPNLRRIDLTDATVSAEAIAKLRAKIPDVAGVE